MPLRRAGSKFGAILASGGVLQDQEALNTIGLLSNADHLRSQMLHEGAQTRKVGIEGDIKQLELERAQGAPAAWDEIASVVSGEGAPNIAAYREYLKNPDSMMVPPAGDGVGPPSPANANVQSWDAPTVERLQRGLLAATLARSANKSFGPDELGKALESSVKQQAQGNINQSLAQGVPDQATFANQLRAAGHNPYPDESQDYSDIPTRDQALGGNAGSKIATALNTEKLPAEPPTSAQFGNFQMPAGATDIHDVLPNLSAVQENMVGSGQVEFGRDANGAPMLGQRGAAQERADIAAGKDLAADTVDVTGSVDPRIMEVQRQRAYAEVLRNVRGKGAKASIAMAKDVEEAANKLEGRILEEQKANADQLAASTVPGIVFNKKTGKYLMNGREISAEKMQEIQLAQHKAMATNVHVGMNATDAAKTELLNQGISDMAEFKAILMPDGKTIDREIVLGMNVPGTAGIPGTDSRIAYSLIYNAVEAKLRAESGAAVPEKEVTRMAERFIPSPVDNDETIKSKVRRMEAFLRGSFGRIKNAGEPDTKKSEQPASAANELTATNPKTGQRIISRDGGKTWQATE